MVKNAFLKAAAALVVLAATTIAPAIVLEGFENNANPFTWADVGSPQSQNKASGGFSFATNASAPAAVPTEGVQVGRFAATWTVPGAALGSHPTFLPGTATTFWALRINAAGGPSQSSVPHTSVLQADVVNNSPDTYDFFFTLLTTDGLKNLPPRTVAPGTSTISWDLNLYTGSANNNAGVLGFTGTPGQNYLDGTSSKIRGAFFYTETAPTAAMSVDFDNVQLLTAQTDFTAPATPTILSVSQGPAAGELVVKWVANTEPDLATYNVYLGTNANFSSPITNRLSLPSTPVAVVTAPATQTTLTGVDTTQPVYVRVTAVDNATPSANESGLGIALGAALDPLGAPPKDLVVLDYDRYAPAETLFTQNGYAHGVVYYAHALQTKGRTFSSAVADAVEDGSVTLTADNNNVVYWASSLDGETVPGQAINSTAQTALTTYVNAGGNLFISGNAIGEDLVTNATGPTFMSGILNATLVSDNSAINSVDNTGGQFPTAAATFFTGTDVFNLAGYPTLDNEIYTPLNSAVGALSYTGNTSGNAAILNNGTTVLLGFGFESVRDINTTGLDFTPARAVRDALLGDAIDYLTAAPASDATSWAIYE
ncbi:hypothetical protein IT570_09810 [Candidatus Sumerlaeota bacterium]|nr:hypothetical protein [Candidatus Sumerlaeota bacterium]